jgi:hypothetical protein
MEMAQLVHADWPLLKAAWDAYGHMTKFEDLDGIKVRSDGFYAVVRYKTEDGMVGMADLYRTGRNGPWEMQNDGFDEITEKQWNKLRIVPDCDWFEIN